MTAESISYTSKGKTLMQNTTVGCPQGSVTALIGPSGSGKTILLQILGGILKPDTGRIRIGISPEKQMSSFFPPQSITYDRTMSLKEYIRANIFPFSSGNLRRMELLSEKLSISDRLKNPVSSLSDTIIRLGLLASSLSVPASTYILDNPEACLDPVSRIKLIQTLVSLSTGDNVPVILASNDVNFALAASSRYIALYDGKTVASGQTSSLTGNRLRNLYGADGEFQNNITTGKGEFLFYNQI